METIISIIIITLYGILFPIVLLTTLLRMVSAQESIASTLIKINRPQGEHKKTGDKFIDEFSEFVDEINGIILLKPDMKEILQEANQFNKIKPIEVKRFMQRYKGKPTEWLMDRLTNPSGFRASYGLMLIEAYNRKLDLTNIAPMKDPYLLPKR